MLDWQPSLTGALVRLRPLKEEDFDELFSAAADPLIWEQHPDRERYTRVRFEAYFRTGIESKGALVVIDQATSQIIGSSRFTGYDPEKAIVEVGYTFVTRSCWGRGHNRELKFLMLNYGFQFVDAVHFYVGEKNIRSQTAMSKLGAKEIDRTVRPQTNGENDVSIQYEIKKTEWATRAASFVRSSVRPSFASNASSSS